MNRLRLTGNVGRVPEMRTTKTGLLVANFSVADSKKKPNTTGKNREDWDTQWFYCTAFGECAAAIEQQVHKGDRVEIEGRIDVHEYKDKNGIDRTAYQVVVFDIAKPVRAAQQQQNGGFNQMGQPAPNDEEIPF